MPEADKTKNGKLKLAKAKLILSGEKEAGTWQQDDDLLEKRRQEASRALASDDQKKVWEETEKARLNKIESQKKLAELETKRRLNEEKEKKDIGAEQKKKDEEAEKERSEKIEKILQSQQEIDKIKKGDKDNNGSVSEPDKIIKMQVAADVK